MSKYTEAEKKRALDLYVLYGPCRASAETGIPKGTIGGWAKKLGLETKSAERMQEANEAREARIVAKRAMIKERCLDEALYCAEAIHNPHIEFKGQGAQQVTYPVAPASAVQNYATSFAIFIDKFRLESGEVTSRDEHHNVTESELDRDIDGFLAEMARREEAGAEGAADPAEARLEPTGQG